MSMKDHGNTYFLRAKGFIVCVVACSPIVYVRMCVFTSISIRDEQSPQHIRKLENVCAVCKCSCNAGVSLLASTAGTIKYMSQAGHEQHSPRSLGCHAGLSALPHSIHLQQAL